MSVALDAHPRHAARMDRRAAQTKGDQMLGILNALKTRREERLRQLEREYQSAKNHLATEMLRACVVSWRNNFARLARTVGSPDLGRPDEAAFVLRSLASECASYREAHTYADMEISPTLSKLEDELTATILSLAKNSGVHGGSMEDIILSLALRRSMGPVLSRLESMITALEQRG